MPARTVRHIPHTPRLAAIEERRHFYAAAILSGNGDYNVVLRIVEGIPLCVAELKGSLDLRVGSPSAYSATLTSARTACATAIAVAAVSAPAIIPAQTAAEIGVRLELPIEKIGSAPAN